MKPENRAFLEANRHHHTTLVKAQYMRHLNSNEREGMQRIMREEFNPNYTSDLWCPPCVADMVTLVYRLYDEYLQNNPDPITNPIIPAPIKEVHATFPSHKNKNRFGK